MTLLYPFMLWGILALLIPIAIHFWYQKKGKIIAWAAMQWLIEKKMLQPRGIRISEILLLILRCSLLLVLVLLLSKPITSIFESKKSKTRVHLVQPDAKLVDEYKFELQTAIDQGDKLYWIGPELVDVEDLANVPTQVDLPIYLQSNLNRINNQNVHLNLYIMNRGYLAESKEFYVTEHFQLYAAVDSSKKLANAYLPLTDQELLSIEADKGGARKIVSFPDSRKDLYLAKAATKVHNGPIRVQLNFKNYEEREVVSAALMSIKDVYKIPIQIEDTLKNVQIDWVLSDQKPNIIDPLTLYTISDADRISNINTNVSMYDDPFTITDSELVRNGQLPEQLFEDLLTHLKMKEKGEFLSSQQLQSMFVIRENASPYSYLNEQLLMLLFMVLLIAERWISLRKSTGIKYE